MKVAIVFILILTTVDVLLSIINNLKLKKMGQELDDLTAEVAETKGVVQSAIVLITGFKQKLDDAIASGNPAALKALSDDLGETNQALADAVAQNPLP